MHFDFETRIYMVYNEITCTTNAKQSGVLLHVIEFQDLNFRNKK